MNDVFLLEWCLLKWPWSATYPQRGKKERGPGHTHALMRTHSHTHKYIYTSLDLVRLFAGSHYLELWDQRGMVCVFYVCFCVCVKGVSVKGCQCDEMGEVVPNESPRSTGLSLTTANFTWHCRAAAEHGLATNRHASVSIRKRCPLSGAHKHTHIHHIPLNAGLGLVSGFPQP